MFTKNNTTRTTSFKYEDNRITQTSDIPGSDSVIYTLDGLGNVIKEENYEFDDFNKVYELDSKSEYKWTGKNVSGIYHVGGTTLIESEITLTFDTNPNPMCFFQNFVSMSDYVGGGLYNLIHSGNNILSEYTIFDKVPDDNSRSDYIYTYKDGYPVTLDIKTNDYYSTDTYHAYITYEYY